MNALAQVEPKVIKGVECLLSEDETIEALGYQHRRNPRSSIRWATRKHGLRYIDMGRGIRSYSRDDVNAFIANRLRKNGGRPVRQEEE